MATYLVTPDDYAGWNPTGRNFAYAGGVIGAIGLLCLLILLGRHRPAAASDQMFLSVLVWIGAGGFALMVFAALGSISLSLKTRGTVTLTDTGVTRIVGKRTHSLAWNEIMGFVPMPQGGVTLISTTDKPDIFVPRFLDDYRACIAELKDHGVQGVPPNHLRTRPKKQTWLQSLATFAFVFFHLCAVRAGYPHAQRIAFFVMSLAVLLGAAYYTPKYDALSSRWFSAIVFCGLALWSIWSMAQTW